MTTDQTPADSYTFTDSDGDALDVCYLADAGEGRTPVVRLCTGQDTDGVFVPLVDVEGVTAAINAVARPYLPAVPSAAAPPTQADGPCSDPIECEHEAALGQAREQYMAGLRRADEMNNSLMEEVQRYADGTERPVLWSVYNEMHKRALTAEARAAAMERAMESTAADALAHGGCHRKLMAQCLRAERAEAVLARIGQMADVWERRLPEVIRTPAVVSAIRAAMEAVDAGGSRLAEAPQPETQAGPVVHEWFVETRMLDGRWSKYGAPRDTAADGRELFERDTTGSGKTYAFRLVHATTTYAIEAEHAPAVVAQPGKENDRG